ncbi:MAG TPA: polymer-forming cytoskeletal protein [Nitrospira sp.]|jgi:cytoskeletal protein CcmA (bactofilin family)|nr:polymer-forming cytoskeletal protein [Nitrospira sp.]MCC7471250.1 polymer-forming cytoskeletal protein [Candidatus Nomurabacteria bacterium]MBS0160776.1 polymer-forming cytoskeletal protein [Nitrospira sp.]MBS0163382.1 polymer-forming cytoskeletal protein [Nitrospira sp.]MBS0172668.1 polymer-forming cytoskeletal protein [Nitrospira sp.]
MWIKDKPEGKRQAGQSEGMEMDNLEAAVPREGSEEINAFVGKGVSFKGVISYNGTVRIDGNLDGEIHTEGVLLVGEDAVLTAKITAGTVVCKGKITGDISAREKVKLRAPAVVNAGVKAPLLAMEEGVVFNGTLEMSQTGTREPQGTTRGQGVKLVNG